MVSFERRALIALWAMLGLTACTAPNPAYHLVTGDLSDVDADVAPADPVARDAAAQPGIGLPDAAPPQPIADAALDRAVSAEDASVAKAPASPDAPVDTRVSIDVPAAPSGLVARWRLDPGPTTIPDDFGTADGKLGTGASWSATPGPTVGFGDPGALALDGNNSAATLGTATLPRFEQAKSITFWFHLAAAVTAPRKSIVVLADPAGHQAIQLGLESGKVAAWPWQSPTGSDIVAAPSTATAGWHHVGYTFDGTTHTLYLAGKGLGTSTHIPGSGPIVELLLGTYNVANDTSERFAGLIDDVRVYNRALSAKEVAAIAGGAP